MIRHLDPSELAGARLFLPEIPVSRRHTSALASLVDHQGVEAHAFVHDLLPLSHPEFFLVDPRLEFLDYLALLRSCNTLVAASEDVVSRVAQITTALWDGSSPLPQVRRAALPTSYTPMAKPWLAPDVPTFVAVGTLEPRKNLIVLFQAARLLGRTRRIRISVFYTRGALSHELREAVDAAKRSGVDVLLEKSRSDHEVEHAVRGANALVYASLAEGYGLPVVEALSVGTPVVTSNRRPLSEHSDYGGVLQVDPASVVDLVVALDSLCDPDVRRRVAASIEASRIPHDWSKWAGEFLDPDSQPWTQLY